MKTIGMIKIGGRTFSRDLPNSAPVDTTISTEMAGIIVCLEVDHVHIALDQDIRVLCLICEQPLQPAWFMNGIEQRWRSGSSFDELQALDQAQRGWDKVQDHRAAA